MAGQLGIEVGFSPKAKKSEEKDVTIGFDSKESKSKDSGDIKVGFGVVKTKKKKSVSPKVKRLEMQNKLLMEKLKETEEKVDTLIQEMS